MNLTSKKIKLNQTSRKEDQNKTEIIFWSEPNKDISIPNGFVRFLLTSNRGQLKNPDISGTLYTLRIQYWFTQTQNEDGARDRMLGSLIDSRYLFASVMRRTAWRTKFFLMLCKRRYNFVIDNKLKNLSERIIILFVS